jgi:rod shape determining protein RodA
MRSGGFLNRPHQKNKGIGIMFDRRLAQHFDWGLLGLVVAISLMGLMALYSAVTAGADSSQHLLHIKQLIWYSGGLGVMVVSFLFNYKALERWGHIFYGLSVLLLVAVLFFGKSAGGSQRWLSMGPVSIQPSELAKIGVIIFLARYYSKNVGIRGFTLRELVTPIFFTMIPFVLIVRQPDLGTGMVLALIAVSMTIFVKIERRSFAYIIAGGVVILPPVWLFLLKGYQKQRILTFLNPDLDPLGTGYHIIQSKIAIGSGMISGKGFLKGTQNALAFLPEQHTDFIFSVLSEEWGFAGSVVLLLVFFMILIWGLNIALCCRDPFGTILTVGISAMIFWQVFINIGMVMGLMPVVGVPLPFVSYGGSSVVSMMICVGLLMNVSMRRFMIE